jgi:hypothetical protein
MEVCRSNSLHRILHAHTGTRFVHRSIRLNLVLATVPFLDHLYYNGSKKTRPRPVRSG